MGWSKLALWYDSMTSGLGSTPRHVTKAFAAALTKVVGGSIFSPIHAQQFALSFAARILARGLHCEQAAAEDAETARTLSLSAQQTLPDHRDAHMPGAIAFANNTIAIAKRVAIRTELIATTSIIEHYRHPNTFPHVRKCRLQVRRDG